MTQEATSQGAQGFAAVHQYVAIWKDEHGINRAWGLAPTITDAERMADMQATKYVLGRPDVVMVERITYLQHDAKPDEIVGTSRHNDATSAMDHAEHLAQAFDDETLATRLTMLADEIHNKLRSSFSREERAAFLDEAVRRLRGQS